MSVPDAVNANATDESSLTARQAALAGVAAGAAGLGVAELLAGLLPGAASPIIAVGDLVISLQPPGAKQIVVDLFGTADKLVLNLFIAIVALGLAALVGIVARRRPQAGLVGFGAFGVVILAAALSEPLTEPITTLAVAFVAVVVATWTLDGLLRLARERGHPPLAEMPAWGRRRFIGTSIGVMALAAGGGALGRALLDRGGLGATSTPRTIPDAMVPAPAPPAAAALNVEGISPLVTPTAQFYRIDTALLVPRPDVASWSLTVDGLVQHPIALSYADLLAMPLIEQYVTIACVSNEVGGELVGNALWKGVRLKALFQTVGVRPEATQVVGRAVDGFTVGFPFAHAIADDREPMVALAMNGEPLPANHGFPARLIVPGLFGYVSATKWLSQIELTTWEAFDAYWVPLGWSKTGPILTQSRIDTPRFGQRIPPGRTPIAGVAWAPDRGISAVEVQLDGGPWTATELAAEISDATWRQWLFRWDAEPGDHVISVRATDGNGELQSDARTPPAPDGARGYHTVRVSVG